MEQASLIAEDMEAQSAQLSHDISFLLSLEREKNQAGEIIYLKRGTAAAKASRSCFQNNHRLRLALVWNFIHKSLSSFLTSGSVKEEIIASNSSI